MRASFFMPTGTVVGSTTTINPYQIYSDTVTGMFISGTSTVNVVQGAVVAAFTASDINAANNMIQQINNAMAQSGGAASPPVITPLTWTSITPSTQPAVQAGLVFAVVGTGFLSSGIVQMRLHNATNNFVFKLSTPAANFSIVSDISIALNNPTSNLSNLVVWQLQYSMDGTTWTNAGSLTVTAT
jgi:hypothetical protein